MSNTNQEEAEATVRSLQLGLCLLSPSPECEAAIKPFLCLYQFGLCDSDNQPHRGTRASCERLRDDVVPWLVNVVVSELINIHSAGRCWISGGKFKCGFALCARVA